VRNHRIPRRAARPRRRADDATRHYRRLRGQERRLAKASPKPPPTKRLKPAPAASYAETILAERGPLTLLELAVAVQQAGFSGPRASGRC